MMFYLGNKILDAVPHSTKQARNQKNTWEYGYNEEYDIVIISKDGTIGDIYEVYGIKIALPLTPDRKTITNYEKTKRQQKWQRESIPEGLNEETMGYDQYQDYIAEQFEKREKGTWVYINEKPIYLTGTYWFGLQWCRESTKYPSFRIIQNELMIFWEACKADHRCYGMQYVKNRRFGASFLSIVELVCTGIQAEDSLLGIVSKKGDDSKKIFRRLVKVFRRLPCFFQPIWDGTNNPKTELVLEEPTKRRSKGDKITEGSGLGTLISWHNTDLNAMDGDEILRSLLDESSKYPKQVLIDEYWPIVKTSHEDMGSGKGKCMMISTVNSLKKGGQGFKNIWNDSDATNRDENNETKSGLYQVFIPADYGLAGYYDQYGFTILEDPEKPVLNDFNKPRSIGSKTYLDNKENSFLNEPEKLNERKRQYPRNIKDAFRDKTDDCEFNLIKIQEQLDHNEYELEDKWNSSDGFLGNNDLERGNFRWENGIKDTKVIWYPDPDNGRFFIKKGCHPPSYYRNKFEMKFANGRIGKSPLASLIGCGGIDPYNRSKNSDGRGSSGSYHLSTGYHTCEDLPINTTIVEYIARPKKIELYFEDMIMVSVYFSMPFLCELSNERFLAMVKERGYRNFSKNNPYKRYRDLNPTEKEFGGAPAQDSKIGEGQFYTTEAFVEDHLGVARDERHRAIGEMGDFPFTRTLQQLKDVDTNDRTKFDAYISFSLSRIGVSGKMVKKEIDTNPEAILVFDTYDNSGMVSSII